MDHDTDLLSQHDLSGHSFAKADLRRQLFQGTLLDGADFTGANLRGARFLPGLGLFEEDMSGDYEGSMRALASEVREEGGWWKVLKQEGSSPLNYLPPVYIVHGVRSTHTSLRNAKLEYADLRGAVIVGATMTGVSLRGSKMGDSLIDADLSQVDGLGEVEHTGPSRLSHRAIRSLGHPLPIDFLRGCGLSDFDIASAKLFNPALRNEQITDLVYELHAIRTDSPIQFYSVFISYSHSDKDFAQRLYMALQQRGIRCWYDEHSMEVGEDISEAIDAGINVSDKVLLCCSRNSLTQSWWVDSEINRIFAKERKNMRTSGKKALALIPLDLDGYMFSEEWQSAKREDVHTRLAANFVNWHSDRETFERGVERVINALALKRQLSNA